MSKRKKRRIRNIAIFLICITAVCLVLYSKLDGEESIAMIDEIEKYGYTLDKNDSALMKSTYEELKKELVKTNIDYQNYANLIAKLFIIDLYSIDTKSNMYDIGGIEYVLPSKVNEFKLKVQDTLYNNLPDKNKRDEAYPLVNQISIVSSDVKNNLYHVELEWKYEKDMGYDNTGVVELQKEDDKVYVVFFEGGLAS